MNSTKHEVETFYHFIIQHTIGTGYIRNPQLLPRVSIVHSVEQTNYNIQKWALQPILQFETPSRGN